MEEHINIDELLNGFIDGELTPRHQTEVQRLIAHDARIAKRLQELQKCKMLVSSLPCAEAPAGMLEEIKDRLEKRPVLGYQPERFDEREGVRHLLVRKVLAAAAMIGLVAVLGVVIYTIVAPESVTEKPIAVEEWRPVKKIEVETPSASVVASAEESIAEAGPAVRRFGGRLELKTSDLIAVDAFINRAIEDNGLLDCVHPRSQEGRSEYALSCSVEALRLLLADLKNVWDKFDSATLFVETEQIGEHVMVESVSAEQIVEIVNQVSFEKRIKVAKDFAVLNNVAELLPGKEVLAVLDDRSEGLITIPKPVLTSSEKTLKRPATPAEDREGVHLTIVVAGGG